MTFPDAIEALRRRHGFRLLSLGGGFPPAAFDRRGAHARLLTPEQADAEACACLLALHGLTDRHFAVSGLLVSWPAGGTIAAWRTGLRLLAQGQGGALERRPVDGQNAHDRLLLAGLSAEARALLDCARTDDRLRWRAPGPLMLRRACDLVLLLPDGARDSHDVVLAWWQTP